ncbi:glycosyltransferase family 2 protein [Microbacterium xanthum]|uniref:glycosyltransferase family 2 protein n=1 Tax=Microbacterium xanthum TaxID=3079794 RepID=UPI002AD5B3DC|nr:glycosyltransferase family 2 protein [Microbacterium sp. KSW-48]MDZ8171044.1 glycosyltransferase family 2 protein [Microbacterium sp. KSW-48]
MPADAPTAPVLLSVVIPTHDVGAWIAETLTSVLAQDIADMEVIVVDDASTDDTAEIVSRFAASDDRVRLVHAALRGGGSARNRGVQEAAGRYLVFCDGDDLVPQGAYRSMVGSLEDSGSDIAFGDFLKFSPTDTWRPTASMAAYARPARGIRLVDEPTLILARPCWNKVFRREFWTAAGIAFPDVPRSNDIVPMVSAYARAERVDILSDVVYLYRERPGATSMTAKADSADSVLSYLTQERECARVIADLGDAALTSAYRRLIWDRDGFVHVAKFAASDERGDREGEIAAMLADLLALVGPAPVGIAPFKVLTLTLAARSQWTPAKVASGWETRYDTPDLGELAALLDALAQNGERLAPDDRIAWLSVRALQSWMPDRTEPAGWAAAAAALARQCGDRILARVAEIGSAALDLGDVVAERRAVAALATRLRGGTTLHVTGQSDLGADDCVPVLWPVDGESAVIEPTTVSWQRVEPGDDDAADLSSPHRVWTAEYPRKNVPTHVLFQPALRLASGLIVTADSRPPLPDYSVMDSFIYERHRDVVVIYRRRGRIVRAVRRAFIIAGTAVMKLLRRGTR